MAKVDWQEATNAERAALYQLCKAIVAQNALTWDGFFEATLSRQPGTNIHMKDNFRRGTISCAHAAVIVAWIAKHHAEIASEIAPDLFDARPPDDWEALIDQHAIYGQLHIRLLKSSRGIVQSAINHPVATTPIRFGQQFCFDLTIDKGGHIIAFQAVKSEWYPLPLDMKTNQLTIYREAGQHLLPWDDDKASPHPIAEYAHDGLHLFVFVVGTQDTIEAIAAELTAGASIEPQFLSTLAKLATSEDNTAPQLHSLNQHFRA